MSDPSKPGRQAMDRMKDEAREGADNLRAQAEEVGGGIKDEAAAAFEEVKAQGASVAAAARERIGTFAEEKKVEGIRQAEGLADAIHRAADQIDDTAPWMSRYVHEAADSVGGMARSLRDRRPRELIDGLEDMARRQPMAFFGAAALAGFAIARFARSSPPSARGMRHRASGSHVPGWRTDRDGGQRPATMAGATLGGAAARQRSDRDPSAGKPG